jgi:putative transcriptional regulator
MQHRRLRSLVSGVIVFAFVATLPAEESRTEPPKALREPAAGTFLVARRSLTDPNFEKTVVLLLRYDVDGALGIVVNRPTKRKLSERLAGLDVLKGRDDLLYAGGPVSKRDLVVVIRTTDPIEGSHPLLREVRFGAGEDLIEDLAGNPETATRFRVYRGYAGWAPGQLDLEIARGGWYVSTADAATVFAEDPGRLWAWLISILEQPSPDLRTRFRPSAVPDRLLTAALRE